MEMPLPLPRKIGIFTKFLFKIAGVDEETIRHCPDQDWDNVRAVAEIMLFTLAYQTALFALIGHRLFASPGQIRPDLIAASLFIATFIMLIDSYVVMRSGWHLSGIEELKRGGLDISGGAGARIKATLFLILRILFSAVLAQLTAIFLSLLFFNADIMAQLQRFYIEANAPIVAAVTVRIDGEIQAARNAEAAETDRNAQLLSQIAALRQNQIDPSAGDPQLQQATQEVTQLQARKAQADDALAVAQTFATNELGGIKGAPGNSGLAGDGARHRAAVAAVEDARARAQEVGRALDAAQTRADALRKQLSSAKGVAQQHAQRQLPAYEADLTKESAQLKALQDRLAALNHGREDAIRSAVEQAPDYVAPNYGLLAQIAALKNLAESDDARKAVIILIDLVSFGFELAAVLAKVTSFVPMTYAALLARDAYMRVVQMVDEMMHELGDDGEGDDNPGNDDDPKTPGGPSNDNRPGLASIFGNPFSGPGSSPSQPPRRPRGRPRKTPLN